MRWILILAIAALLPAELTAQPNCKKGIPCGNSCIAANKTCRIGTRPAPAPGTAQPLLGAAAAAPIPDSVRYVGWKEAGLYFKRTCAVVTTIPVGQRLYFRDEKSSKAAGLKPSSVNADCP